MPFPFRLRPWKTHKSDAHALSGRAAGAPRRAVRRRPTLEGLEDRIVLTHFRYGTIDWVPVSGSSNTIQFHLTQAWRESYPWGSAPPVVGSVVSPGSFAFGDGTSAPISLSVKSVNTADDYFIGEATLTHTYSSTGSFTALMVNSARISTLKDNADGSFQTQTRVNVGGAGSSNPFPGNASPVSSLAPIIQVADNQIWTFQLPAIDPNGDALTYRLATNSEAGYGFASSGIVGQPTNFSISSGGLISWNVLDQGGLATNPGDLWTAQVMVEDRTADGILKSSVPVDFILKIANPQHVAPKVTASPTGPFQPVAFTTLTFNVAATAQAGFNITSLQALNAPSGMTFSEFGSPANSKSITATWTPTQAQANQTYIVTFQATDNTGATDTTAVTISPQAASFATTTTILAPDVNYNADGAVTVKVASSGGGTPTGTVTLSVDGRSPLTGTLNASGVATFNIPIPDAGNHSLSTSYAAQGSFLASSATGTLRVIPAPTAIQIQVATVTYNEDGTANVTVTSAAGVPTGIVTLSVDGRPPMSQALTNGSTVFIISAPDAGAHSLHAEYAAQGNYAASTADAALSVDQAPTSIAITAPTVTYSDDGIVTLTVAAAPGVPTPTGAVTLAVDGDLPIPATLAGGVATFTIPGLAAGNHPLHAAYGQQGDYAGSTADAVLHVNAAPTAMNIDALALTYGADGTVMLTVAAAPGVPTPTGAVTLAVDGGSPISAMLLPDGSATFTIPSPNAGDHALYATYAAQGNYSAAAAVGELHVDPAPLTVTVDDVSKVYGPDPANYSAHISGLLHGDDAQLLFDSEGAEPGAGVGTYDILLTMVPDGATSLANYRITVILGVLTITPADLYVTAEASTKVYGQTAVATGTVSGAVNDDAITAVFASGGGDAAANAGTYTITASLLDPDGRLGNYTVHQTDAILTVNRAKATIVVQGTTATYDGHAHGATGGATGVKGESLSGLDLGVSFTDAPGGTASWTFTDPAGNYSDAAGTVDIVITRAHATVSIHGYSGTYDGAAHGLTGSATGVRGEDLSGLLDLGAGRIDAGSYPTSWSFAGSGNYDSDGGTAPVVIDKTTSTTSVTGGTFIYDQAGHEATGASVTGAGGLTATPTLVYKDAGGNVLAGLPTGAGSYTVCATYDGDANHTGSSATAAIVIQKASSAVTVVGGSFTYDGQAHPATGSVKGVNGTSLGTPTFTYSYTDEYGNVVTTTSAPVEPGYYTVTATFAGDSNHNPASATATIMIAFEVRTLTDLSKAFNSGRTIPIKLQLTDTSGKNVSSAGIDVTAIRLERVNADGSTTQAALQDAGNANPENLFRYDAALGGYIFNLSTKGLGAGTYNFYWTAEGDPAEHKLTFKLV